jgi:hypothetical protein
VKYFVLVYDKMAGMLREEREFAATEGNRAFDERRELMVRYRGDPNIEVAVLGADSRSDLVRTHSRYFKTLEELAARA